MRNAGRRTTLDQGIVTPLPEFASVADRTKFLAKARQFLKAHENRITIHRLRLNQPLTGSDFAELERMMLEAGVGTPDDIARAKEKSRGLGVFIRSLVARKNSPSAKSCSLSRC